MSQPITNIQQHLLDLVNARLQTELTLAQVDYAPLVLVDPTVLDLSVAGKRNTSTKISTKSGAEPSVDLDVTYNRLQLQKLFSLRSKQFEDNNETTTLQLLPKLSARANLTLTADDIIDEPISRTGDAPFNITVKAKATSYLLFGELAITLGEGSTGPVDPEPVAGTGFFMSNMAARALTSDFATYQAVPDELAPVFGTRIDWAKTEAAIGDKAGRLWAFMGKSEYTFLHRSTTGGQSWTKDQLPGVVDSQLPYSEWKFNGRMLAYFKGAVYGYFKNLTTNILWVCRLQEEAETGGMFDIEPIMAMEDTYLPSIAADGEYLVLTSREADPDRISYEPVTYLHYSTDANNWNKVRLSHSWSTNPMIWFQPEVMVHSLAVKDGIICGVGSAQNADVSQMEDTTDVYFEVDITNPNNSIIDVKPMHYWPSWATDVPGAWPPNNTADYKSMQVIGDKVLIYIDQQYIQHPDTGLVDRYGTMVARKIGDIASDTIMVLAESGVAEGRIYDNGQRVVVSGRRPNSGTKKEFLAYTDDRVNLTGWVYGSGSEELFADVDLERYVTYVSATQEGETDPLFIPQLTPIVDVRFELPAVADNIVEDGDVAAYVQQFAQQSDGKVLVAGAFERFKGQQQRRYLLRLNDALDTSGGVTSAIDTTFTPAFSASQTNIYDVGSMVVCPDDSILMAGSIERVNNVNYFGFARVPANGGAPSIWPQPELFDEYGGRNVNNAKLFKTPDGKIWLISATLRKVGVNDCYHIAKFNADGTVDGSWNNPFNPGGANNGNDFRSAFMMPNGDLIVNRGSNNGYQPLLIKADGTVPANQPFKANVNCEIYNIWRCPYTNGWLVHANSAILTVDDEPATGLVRLTSSWAYDGSWNGLPAGDDTTVTTDYFLRTITPLSDNTGFLVAKNGAYWHDQNGRHYGHERDLLVVDQNGTLQKERLPLWANAISHVIADVNNTGSAAQDSYLIGGQYARVHLGEYPRSTITFNRNYIRIRVLPAVEEEVPQA